MRVRTKLGVTIATTAALVATAFGPAGAATADPPVAAPTPPPIVNTAPIPVPAAKAPPAPVVEARGALATRDPLTLTQPDGTGFTARQWGDGAHHGHELLSGHTIDRDSSGTWRYVARIDDGDAVLSSRRADLPAPRGLATGLRPADQGPFPTPGDAPSDAPFVPHTGNAPTVVILTQFADFTNRGTTPAQWASSFFGASSSVKKYYDDASYGDLDVIPAAETSGTANDGVVGWVTLARNHPRSGHADFPASATADNGVVRDAVLAANSSVNFATYDTNGNGAIEPRELHVVIIAAGYEASTGCGEPTVWAHWYRSYYATPPVVDGKTVAGTESGGYTMFGEMQCGVTDHMATIGVMVHELGHDIGFPDLYDTTSATVGGVGKWSVMSYGSHNTTGSLPAGSVPPLPDPFLRSLQGWSTPTAITGTNQNVTVPSATSSSTIYRAGDNPGGVDWASLWWGNQTGSGQYFLIENRQQTGWDAGLPGCGVLIWHITEGRPTVQPNDAPPRLVQLEQADGSGHLDSTSNAGDAGDPYPGSANRTVFNLTSTPNSRLNNGSDSGVSVTVPSGACTASKAITVTNTGPTGPTAPVNDNFASATTISGTTGTVSGSTVDATSETGEPEHGGTTGGSSSWWRWTAPASGYLDVATTGSSYDTTLGVYTGSSVSTLTEVASNDDALTGGLQSGVVAVPVSAGTTYRIAVDGYAGASGAVSLRWKLSPGGPAPFGNWGAFVDRQFVDFLGAFPTSASRSQWVTYLTANPTRRGALIAALRNTSHHTGIVDPVVRLYTAYFLRYPDRAGLQYWISQRTGGRSLTQVSNSFAASPEFRSMYGSLNDRQFVERVYLNVLGRPGEQSGIDFWTGQLSARRRTRGQVMIGFSESPEYRTQMTVIVDTSVVTLLMLRRAPTGPEVDYWFVERQSGRLSDERLGEWVLGSAAYDALV